MSVDDNDDDGDDEPSWNAKLQTTDRMLHIIMNAELNMKLVRNNNCSPKTICICIYKKNIYCTM